MKRIERVYPWLLLTPAILPFVVWGGFIHPLVAPRALFFYAVSLISISWFIVLVAQGRGFFWGRLQRPIAWIPGLLLLVAYITSFFGVDFYRSFWSSFAEENGLLSLTCLVSCFYLILLYADKTFFTKLLYAVSIIGSVIALGSIGSWCLGVYGAVPFGNEAFLAGYLTLTLFATCATARTLHTVWRRVAYGAIVIQLLAIILTGNRGSLLALGITLVIALLWIAYSSPGKWRYPSIGVLVALLLLSSAFIAFRTDLARTPFTPLSRVASTSFTQSSVSDRLFLWDISIAGIVKSPVLGVGADNGDIVFNRLYDPTKLATPWFTQSYNSFLDYGLQYGIAGLLLYIVLIGAFISIGWRQVRKGDSLYVVLTLLAIAYAVQNFFISDTVSTLWLFLVLFACMFAISYDTVPQEGWAFSRYESILTWVAACIVLACIIPVSILPAYAAYDLARADTLASTNPEGAIQSFSQGIAFTTYDHIEYGYAAYNIFQEQETEGASTSTLADTYQAALNSLSSNFNRYTYDERTALNLAELLSNAPTGTSVDNTLFSAALQRAILESPRRPEAWYLLVNLTLRHADTFPAYSNERTAGYAAAQDLITRYSALVPTLAEPYFILAQVDLALGQMDASMSAASLGTKYYTSNLAAAQVAAAYYQSTHNVPEETFFLHEVARLSASPESI